MKCAVLLSGGVDSSVALARLVHAGYEVEAFYLKIWLADELAFLGDCPWEEDLSYARAVAEKYNVPLHVVPLQNEYREAIIEYIIREVRRGNTPSPDVLCNRFIKFGCFLDHIDDSYEKVATGHYAAIRGVVSASEAEAIQIGDQTFFEPGADGASDASVILDLQSLLCTDRLQYEALVRSGNVRYQLCTVPDLVKDQTYFLSQITYEQLSRVIFPIGDLMKHEVRAYAEREALPTAVRKDSQGVCFLGKISFRQFVEHYVGTAPGPIVEYETGQVLGEHKGVWFYTHGQRRGLELGGGPWYVVAKSVESRTVYISKNYFSPDKERRSFTVKQPHWIGGVWPTEGELIVKLRHGEATYRAQISYDVSSDALSVLLPVDDQGIAPGQFAVFYDGLVCLGSGAIAPASE